MRNEHLLALRPDINASVEKAQAMEIFQNETLRPILKFQHELLKSVMDFYIEKRKNEYYKQTKKEQPKYLENAIKQDLRFKSQLLGLIIGFFTVEEYAIFIANESELTRRITDMLVQRIQSQY